LNFTTLNFQHIFSKSCACCAKALLKKKNKKENQKPLKPQE